jgi:tetratricopeptide (TPR) repeat protein
MLWIEERIAADRYPRIGFGNLTELYSDVALARIRAHGLREHANADLKLRRHLIEHRLHDRGHTSHHDHIADPEARRPRHLVEDEFRALGNARQAQARLVHLGAGRLHPFVGRPNPASGEDIGAAMPGRVECVDDRCLLVANHPTLSKLSRGTVEELVRFDLLNPRGGLFGFRDLASARQISNLFAHGISLSEILRSVKEIRAWLPEADLSSLRLHPAAHRAIEIEQPGGRTDKRGQFMLPVNAPAPNADALFEQAQAAEDAGDIAEAERLYRVLMNCDHTDAAPPFNLGNMFRATGRKIEAEAALRAATRADPTFAEGWYNLSDLLDEQGRSEAAIDCLRRALQAAPDYADAMFNLALLLQRGSRHKEAAECWRQYLANDAQSDWAARARRSLKFCEMQIHLSAA